MGTTRLKFFLIGIVLIGFAGCKQKERVDMRSLSDRFKKECIFQKNSYWVYKNDSTGTRDSTYITGSSISNYSSSRDYLLEYIQTPVESSLFHQFYSMAEPLRNSYTADLFLFGLYNIGWCDDGAPGYITYEDTLTNHTGGVSFNCGTNKDPQFFIYYSTQMGKSSGFAVNGLVFDRVDFTRTTFVHPHTPFSPYLIHADMDTIDFYFSPGNGLVKFILRIDTSRNYQYRKRATFSWSLLKYKVVQ